MKPIRFGEVYRGQDNVLRVPKGRTIGVDCWITFEDLDDGRRKSVKMGGWRRLHAGLKDGGLVDVEG